jgi:hypothetical protein
MPRVFGPHNHPLGRAYRSAWVGLVAIHGRSAKGSAIEASMARAAVASARLALATEAWGKLAAREWHSAKSRADLRAAEKAMARADESMSRALADLRAMVSRAPEQPVMTRAERERIKAQAEFDQVMAQYRRNPAPQAPARSPGPSSIPTALPSSQKGSGTEVTHE